MPAVRPNSAGRPPRAPDRSAAPLSEDVSYEDLIIAQYLEELRKTRSHHSFTVKEQRIPPSPYSQKLPHTEVVPRIYTFSAYGTSTRSRSRPQSAVADLGSGQVVSTSKRKIDAKFIADYNLWEPATPKDESSARRPITRRSRPLSAPAPRGRALQSSRPASAKKSGPIYKRNPRVIVANVHKNGSRDFCVRIASPNLAQLLEQATQKLGLQSAARRAFLEHGVEVFSGLDIPPKADLYVSCGDNYKDPYKPEKRRMENAFEASWTMNGVVVPPNKPTKPRLNKRMKKLAETSVRRVAVYANGKGTESMELPIKFGNTSRHMQEFLDMCTNKFGGQIRRVFNWCGTEVNDLTEIPVIDQCLQLSATPVLGPVWVSKGEGFSPTGANMFVTGILQHTKAKIREAKSFKEQLEHGREGRREKVHLQSILSMTLEEICETLNMVDKDLKEYVAARDRLKVVYEELQPQVSEEMGEGTKYTLTHIKEKPIEEDSSIKIEVYENGTYDNKAEVHIDWKSLWKGLVKMAKTADKDKAYQLIRERFLANCSRGRSDGRIAVRLFDRKGKDIYDVMQVQDGEKVWTSAGEPWKSPYSFVLSMNFSKAYGVTKDGATMVYRDQIGEGDLKNEALKHARAWTGHYGFPPVPVDDVTQLPAEARGRVEEQLRLNAIDNKFHFITTEQAGEFGNSSLIVFPEVIVDVKKRKGTEDRLWPGDEQIWLVSQTGHIYNKAFPFLCLAVSDHRLKTSLGEGSDVDGFTVCVQQRSQGSPDQLFGFGADGHIYCSRHSEMVLTYLGRSLALLEDDEEEPLMNEAPELPAGHSYYLAVTAEFTKRKELQRWAIKQERMDILGQWKKCDVPNTEWNKRALSWPVTQEGEFNNELEWPVEGFLMPCAPPISKKEKQQTPFSVEAKRLLVMKNGESNKHYSTYVVGPDLTNMMHDQKLNQRRSKSRERSRERARERKTRENQDSIVSADMIHCKDLSIRQLEMRMFLERCTSQLDLPFAARRLFDAKGNEYSLLVDLPRDSLVYVSCGEPWIDPSSTKAEQQHRRLMAALGGDVMMIRQFCSLRHPEGVVLAVEGALVAGAGVVLRESALLQSEVELQDAQVDQQPAAVEQQIQDDDTEEFLSSHKRAHLRANEKFESKKRPWERNNTHDDTDEETTDQIRKNFSDKELYHKFRPRRSVAADNPSYELQQFSLQPDGFISSARDPDLVLGVDSMEGRQIQIFLQKKKPDDPLQRWVIENDSVIMLKYNKSLVLSVQMPTNRRQDEETVALTFDGAAVVLQQRKTTQFGSANQKWKFDPDTRQIKAFESSTLDLEITAANKVNVCTATVTTEQIDQPGYIIQLKPHGEQRPVPFLICTSCARAVRGRQKLEKLEQNTDFFCPLGQAKQYGLPSMGSFRCLNEKVDLSTHEANNSLEFWEDKLQLLREETSVRAIARQISAAEQPVTYKIYCYRNGHGRRAKPEVISASSVNGILLQATVRLEMSNAARRIYTETGNIILELNELKDEAKSMIREEKLLHKLNARREEYKAKGEVPPATPSEQSSNTQADSNTPAEKESKLKRKPDDLDQLLKLQNRGIEVLQNSPLYRKHLVNIPEPSDEDAMKWPMEVWISSGEQFVDPKDVDEDHQDQMMNHAERHKVAMKLDRERHALRHMKGRRYDEMDPGHYVSTNDPDQPVRVEGSWQQPTAEEQLKHAQLHRLQTHLSEVRESQKGPNLGMLNARVTRRLYQTSPMIRIQVFPNGENPERAVNVWGESMQQLLDNAKARCKLSGTAKKFYTMNGQPIEKLEEFERDQIVCVSTGKAYMTPKTSKQEVEVRANWGRARKLYGKQATDIIVRPTPNPNVDVNPFDPPVLADPTYLTDRPPRPPIQA